MSGDYETQNEKCKMEFKESSVLVGGESTPRALRRACTFAKAPAHRMECPPWLSPVAGITNLAIFCHAESKNLLFLPLLAFINLY
jgi:hypothetical protein